MSTSWSFDHENTFMKAKAAGKEEAFHRQYENAVEVVREGFGGTHPIFVGGKERKVRQTFDDRSPIDTTILLGKFASASRKDARDAVGAAKKAYPGWAATPWKERVAILRRAADIIAQRKYELAAMMSFENGKNRLEAMADVDEAADLIRWYCQQMVVNDGFENEMPRVYGNEKTKSVLKPYGVWGVVSPFNFPFAIALGMTSGAIITGNTAVLKPASDTPFMALLGYEILTDAGVPPGVLNYVTGAGSTVGAELTENPDIAGFAFTGSRAVGVQAFKALSEEFPKPVVCELGGKNPTIVTDKADVAEAAEGVGRGAFGYGGQKCSACSRVYVHKAVKAEFTEELIEWTERQEIGDPTEREVYLGPLINETAYRNYQAAARRAKAAGKILTGGRLVKEKPLDRGYYVEPTVVDRLPKDHAIFKDELFVPLLAMATVGSLEEGLAEANDSEYGLTAGLMSHDEDEIRYFLDHIEAGVVYVNRHYGSTTGAMVGAQPFGGWKHSGMTGKAAGGLYYLQQFMREQSQSIYS
jgi:1-pyrroline-5-carboxylate dehydrogenase